MREFDPALDDPGAVETTTSALTSYANKALLVTDLTVVRDAARTSDPCNSVAGDDSKVWTIGRMLKKEAERQGKTAQQYVSGWLRRLGHRRADDQRPVPHDGQPHGPVRAVRLGQGQPRHLPSA